MYITKIIVENFQSYYGRSELKLDKNLNLVLGTIGAGKSKLFNAFYWNFFGEIYKYKDGWISVDSSNFLSIFNKMSLKENEDNKNLKAFVEMHIKNDKEYIVTHNIEIKKIKSGDYNSEKNWKFINEELIVSFDNPDGNRIIINNNHDARDYIDKKLLPKEISKYIWFQGETLNELIDIGNGKSFKDAINFISYIGYYDKNIEIVGNLIVKIERSLRKEKKRDTSNKKEYDRINYEIEKLERELPSFEENKTNKVEELRNVEKVIDDIDKRLNDIDEFIELKKNKDELDRELKYLLDEIENLDKNKSNNFSKHWILLGTKSLLQDGFVRLQSFQKWYEEKQNDNPTGLPYNIPSPAFLKEMLTELDCYICGRKFDEDSEAYKYIEKRLELATIKVEYLKQENKEKRMLNNKIVELLAYESTLFSYVDTIEADIKDFIRKNSEFNDRKFRILDEIKHIDDDITILQEKHGNQITAKFSLEKNKYNFNIAERDKIKTTIRHLDEVIYKKKQELISKKSEINSIPPISNVVYKEEEILKYLNFLNDVYIKTKETEFEKLITKIENKANEILTKTTQANNVINGKISIDREIYTIDLIDLDNENGRRDINTGHITLMKMCIINAMVLISNEYKNKSYPFISDAPTSALDDGTTKLYYKVLDDEFEQSIIMTKDLFTYKDGINVVDKNSFQEFQFKNVSLIEKGGASDDLTESNSYSKLTKII